MFIFYLYMDSNSTLRIPDTFHFIFHSFHFCFFLSNIYKEDLNSTSEEPNQQKIQFTDSIVVQPSQIQLQITEGIRMKTPLTHLVWSPENG